jgi:hypothetical protein
VFILSFPVRLEPSDTLVKHNVLLGYDALDMLIGYGSIYGFCACCVRDTYAPARFGELPLLSVPGNTDSRAAHAFPEGSKQALLTTQSYLCTQPSTQETTLFHPFTIGPGHDGNLSHCRAWPRQSHLGVTPYIYIKLVLILRNFYNSAPFETRFSSGRNGRGS